VAEAFELSDEVTGAADRIGQALVPVRAEVLVDGVGVVD
jgi:hypothetical protein